MFVTNYEAYTSILLLLELLALSGLDSMCIIIYEGVQSLIGLLFLFDL